MNGAKVGAAGAKRSCTQSTKHELATKRVQRGVARVLGSGDGGSSVGGEFEGVADATKRVQRGVARVPGSGDGGSSVDGEFEGVADVKLIGVRSSPSIVEIKKILGGLKFYNTVKEGNLVVAIIHDVARVHADPSCPEKDLNILKVGLCITKKAQKVLKPIGKRFVVEFTKRHPLKLDDLPDELFPLKLEGLIDPQFVLLEEQIIKQDHQCFLELKKEITGDPKHHVQGRERKNLDAIQPYLPEKDHRVSAWEANLVKLTKVVDELVPSNGKLLDA